MNIHVLYSSSLHFGPHQNIVLPVGCHDSVMFISRQESLWNVLSHVESDRSCNNVLRRCGIFFRIIKQLFVLGFQYLGAIHISSCLLAWMYSDGRLCGLVFSEATPGRVSKHASQKWWFLVNTRSFIKNRETYYTFEGGCWMICPFVFKTFKNHCYKNNILIQYIIYINRTHSKSQPPTEKKRKNNFVSHHCIFSMPSFQGGIVTRVYTLSPKKPNSAIRKVTRFSHRKWTIAVIWKVTIRREPFFTSMILGGRATGSFFFGVGWANLSSFWGICLKNCALFGLVI